LLHTFRAICCYTFIDVEPETTEKPTLGARLKGLFEKYGQLALVIYFVLFALVFAGFAVAISAGFHVRSTAAGVGLVGSAWLATKLTQPIRIAATLALVPLVARLRRKR
jgi:hypothetical protein